MRLKIVRKKEWTVLACCSDRGDCELLQFFGGLEGRFQNDRDRMLQLLDRVAAHPQGPRLLDDGVSHALRGEIWEFIRGSIRVFWFYDEGRVVVCSHAIVKRSQTIRSQDIDHARDLRDRYLAARKAGRIFIDA